MKILLQIGFVFGLYWISQCVEAALPFPFPASVISLLLLLALLALRVVKVDHIREKADFLLGNLAFFFIPTSVSIMNYGGLVLEHAAAFFIICAVSLVLTFAVTVTVVRLTGRLLERRREAVK